MSEPENAPPEVSEVEAVAPEVAENENNAAPNGEPFHFDHKVFYGYQLYEPGDVCEFAEPDLLNLAPRGHRASDCSGDSAKCVAVAAGNADPATAEDQESTNDDSSAARSNDEGGRPSSDAGQNTCNFPGCGRSFPAGAVALNAHKRQKKH